MYAEKDYGQECDVIERAFREFSVVPVRRILDLGCGTGGHAIPLAVRGYDVLGVDRSPGMLDVAGAKAMDAGVAARITFVPCDLAAALRGEPRDAALMMFNVLGYQDAVVDVVEALRSVRRNLRTGGVFLFDVWHAPAVESAPPVQRWRIIEQAGGRLIRLSSGALDRAAEICTVTIHMLRLAGDRVVEETVEHHRLRYFRRETLVSLLEGAGMELQRLGSFPDYWREADACSWSVLGVARAA
jgi:SAM-dependent methyltransferase